MKKELVSVIMSTYNEPDFFLKRSKEEQIIILLFWTLEKIKNV